MNYRLVPMTWSFARQIAGWRYPAPYDVYDCPDNDDALSELLNGEYLAVLDQFGEPVGFFCSGQAARVPAGHGAGCYGAEALDIGLGMRPDLTGKGSGQEFLQMGIDYFTQQLRASRLRLSVLQFNRRAIKLYQRAGFAAQCEFTAGGGSGQRRFLVMLKDVCSDSPSEE